MTSSSAPAINSALKATGESFGFRFSASDRFQNELILNRAAIHETVLFFCGEQQASRFSDVSRLRLLFSSKLRREKFAGLLRVAISAKTGVAGDHGIVT